MNDVTTYQAAMSASFQNLWNNLTTAIPTFVLALVVFSLGLIVAGTLGRLAKKIVKVTKIGTAVEKAASIVRLQTLGWKLDFADLVGWVVRWFFVVVVFIAVADILKLTQVTTFLRSVAMYIPNVLVAVIVLGLGLMLAKFVGQLVEKAVKSSHLPSSTAGALSTVAEWSVILFSLMAGLSQLGIATQLINILFTGITLAFAIAFGLAFGLGGRDQAKSWLEKINRDMSGK